ncbi:MAG: hypothetical protein AB1598_09485 [Thermodesulfobacteriota bacterium]
MRNVCFAVITAAMLTVFISCARRPEPEIPERKALDPSPTEVVEELLKAWQKEDFKRAFKYVYAPFTDEDGYVIQMKNYFKVSQISILDFHILGTQIYDRTAIVVVELKQKLKSPKTGSVMELSQKSQYDLGIFDDKWKVTSGMCIENCVEREQELKVNQ